MQIPEKNWIVVAQYKDGKEFIVGEYPTHSQAVEVMNSYWESLCKEERDKHRLIYVDSITWLHEVE